MPHTIRPMEPRDTDAVRGLLAQLTGYLMTPEEMADRMAFVENSPGDWLFVAESSGGVCGAMAFRMREMVERPGRSGELYLIVTDQAARRQGIGRALMDFAEQFARDQACCDIWLVSGFKRKDEAHPFYESLGYAATGYRFVKTF